MEKKFDKANVSNKLVWHKIRINYTGINKKNGILWYIQIDLYSLKKCSAGAFILMNLSADNGDISNTF